MMKKLALAMLVLMTTLTVNAELPPGKVYSVQGVNASGYYLKLNNINTLFCVKRKKDNHIFATLDNKYGWSVIGEEAAQRYYRLLIKRYRKQKKWPTRYSYFLRNK